MLILLINLPLYIGIFIIFYKYRHTIKLMSDIENLMSDLMSNIPDKRDFLTERVKNGGFISNSKTPWTEERCKKRLTKS